MFIGSAFVLFLGFPAPAVASCPPLAPGSSWLLSAAVAPLMVRPPNGPAPLEVEIKWFTHPIRQPTRFEFDVDGDGVPEWTDTMRGNLYYPRGTHTYQRPGQFAFTVRVHHAGQVTTFSAPVKVFSPVDFDRELQTRWETMRDSLRRGDVPAALECIHSESRRRYGEIFRLLASDLPNVDKILTKITFKEHRRESAIYEMERIDDGRTKLFDVQFEIDADGIWRVRSF